MGSNLTMCAGRRSSEVADLPDAGRRKPLQRPPKPAPLTLGSRPEVVPAIDGGTRTPSPAACNSGSGCALDPVPDVLPLEAAAQWAREKRQSRRQNSTPATPVSLTFTYTEVVFPSAIEGHASTAAPNDDDCGAVVTSTVLMRHGSDIPMSAAPLCSEGHEIAPTHKLEEGGSASQELSGTSTSPVPLGGESLAIVLSPVPKKSKAAPLQATWEPTDAGICAVPGKPPAMLRLFSMPLPAPPVGTPMLPPRPRHLSLSSSSSSQFSPAGRSPDSPPLPKRCRPTLRPALMSNDWVSIETLAEVSSSDQGHWEVAPDDNSSGSSEMSTDEVTSTFGVDCRLGLGGKGHSHTVSFATDEPHSEHGGSAQKCPRKPPRTYSYKASSQPKRISHTTEEFVEMWDTMRRALSMEQLNEDEGEDGEESRRNDDEDIYQNMYAARMRCWQVLSLAQEVVLDLVNPDAVLDFLLDQQLLNADDYDAIVNVTSDRRERNDALIDLLLERGDGYYDKCREFLRYSSDANDDQNHGKVSRILDALNETFIIGSKANRWNFSLTTRQCSVGYETPEDTANDETAELSDDDGVRPSVRLDIYQENFGNCSCAAVANMLATYDVVSRLSLVKNGISRVGVQKLAPGVVGRRALKKLSLRLNPLRNDGLAVLASGALSRPDCLLVELNLSHTGLVHGAGGVLGQALRSGLPRLRSLDVSHNELDDADCAELAGGLAARHGLAELSLRDNAFSSLGCERVCSAARQFLKPLVRLDVGQNYIGDGGASTLANALLAGSPGESHTASQPMGLVELRAENCGIRSAGCSAIAAAIERPTCCLEMLSISGNPVGDEGMTALAAALLRNKRMKVLCADLCSDASADGLAAVLRTLADGNRSLTQLSACYLARDAEATSDCRAAVTAAELALLASRARQALPGRKVNV